MQILWKRFKTNRLRLFICNMPLSSIEYERCDCKQSRDYWNEIDLKEEKQKEKETI